MLAKASPYGAALAVCLLSAGVAHAASADGEPLSAIDWLSDSITVPESIAPETAPDPTPIAAPEVIVAPLDAPVPDRAGLVPARDLGLPADLWGGSAAVDIARRISAMPDIGTPSLRRLFRTLLILQLDPPVDAIADDRLFLARLDKLLDMAELDLAQRLIAEAGAPKPEWFRREFDIALLKGTETRACEEIERTPDISPTFQARIFCLARNGQWDVAALTLGTADVLALLDDEQEQLLLHFLDPELFEGEPLPAPPAQPSPLTFRLYEAVGERLDTNTLPIAFAVADLSENVGWKTRLRASERLAAAGVLKAEEFLSQATSRKPAASGGLWDRVGAIRSLIAALDRDDAEAVTDALPAAWSAAREGGYAATLAPWLASRIADLELGPAAQHDAFEIALFADSKVLAARHVGASAEDRMLLALSQGNPGQIVSRSPLVTSVRQSLSGLPPSENLRMMIEDGRTGEALLIALSSLADGAEGDPFAIGDGLALLVELGLGRWARRIAVELLLEESLA